MGSNDSKIMDASFIDRIIPAMDVIIVPTVIYCKRNIYFVDKDEQLFVENLTEITVVHGPKVTCLPPWIKSCEKKKVLSLSMAEYCVVKNILSGKKRIEVGP